MMKNLVVFAMIMLILASGYMYGTKLASDMGINKIPTLGDIGSGNLNGQSGKGTVDTTGSQFNPLTSFFNSLKGLWGLIYNNIINWIYGIVPTSTKGLDNSIGSNNLGKIISKEEAKRIAQQYIEEPGAVAGEPVLVNYNGKLVYIVPILLNGERVGEIYIDAKTGQNLGGAGGVSYNEPNNSVNDNSNQGNNNHINNSPNSENNNADSGNTDNGNTNESPIDTPTQTNDSGHNGSIQGIEQP